MNRSRRRWYLRQLLTDLAIATAGVSMLASVLAGFAIFDLFSAGTLSIRAIAAGTAMVAVIGALYHSWLVTPDEPAMVRYIDDGIGLQSRLVTARELELDPPREPAASVVMHGALLRDLPRVARTVRVDRLLPLRFLPLHAVALTVVVGSLGAARIVDVWHQGRDLGQAEKRADADLWADIDRIELGAELERLADLLEEEAAQSGDAYTRALAEQARALSIEMREPGGVGTVGEADVASLLAHIERALGARFAVDGGERTQVAGEAAGQLEEGISGSADLPIMGLDVPMPGSEGRDLVSDVRSVTERLEMVQSQRVENPYGGAFRVENASSSSKVEEAGILADVQSGAAGVPAGAAQRSTDAAGDAAGAGSQDLNQGEQTRPGAFEQGEEVALPRGASEGGARVQASAEIGTDGSGAASVLGRAAGSEAPAASALGELVTQDSVRRDAGGWRREPLGPHARLLAQRLFEPKDLETQE